MIIREWFIENNFEKIKIWWVFKIYPFQQGLLVHWYKYLSSFVAFPPCPSPHALNMKNKDRNETDSFLDRLHQHLTFLCAIFELLWIKHSVNRTIKKEANLDWKKKNNWISNLSHSKSIPCIISSKTRRIVK